MKKILQRLSILLAICMLVAAAAGCQGKGKESVPSTAAGTSTKTEEASQAPAQPEPATITFKTYHAAKPGMENFSETPVGKVIKEKLNITVNVLSSTSDTKEMSIDMAAGNLPDIFTNWASPVAMDSLNTMNKAAKEGLLADLTGAIKANGPVLDWAVQKERLPIFMQQVVHNSEFGGKIYLLPTNYSVVTPWLSGWGLYIRGDVAEKLGVSTPYPLGSTEDLYSLLKKVKEAGIKDTNGKDAYAFGMLQPWPQMVSALNRPFDFGGNMKIGLKDGRVSGFIESEHAVNQVMWVRKLIREGLMDPECFTQKYEIGTEKVAQGKYAVMPLFAIFTLPDVTDYMKTLTSAHPEMAYKSLGNMRNHEGSDTMVINKGMEASIVAAVSQSANVDAAIRLLNFLNDKEGRAIASLGVQGQQWEWNDKQLAAMKPEFYEERMKDVTVFNKKYGTDILALLSGITGTDAPEYNVFGGNGKNVFYLNDPKRDDTVMKIVDEVMPKREIINKLNIDYLLQSFPKKDKIDPVFKQVNDILAQCYLAKSDEEAKSILSKYVDTLNKNGYQEYLTYLQQEYEKNKELYATYITDVQ